MLSKNNIIANLSRDKIRNINLINFIKQYNISSINRIGNTYLIRGTSDHSWVYISSKNISEFKDIIKFLNDKDEYFAIMEDWMLPYILKNKKILWKISCIKLFYPENKFIPKTGTNINDLSPEYAEYIYNNSKYQDYLSIEYIRERINQGISIGIFEDNKLIAWMMTHDDGAMGFLHVLSEYRGRGYGQDISFEMIKRLRKQNKISFVHIEENNIPSMSLALKAGFIKDRRIHYLYLNNY